jgi:hypothetical protein
VFFIAIKFWEVHFFFALVTHLKKGIKIFQPGFVGRLVLSQIPSMSPIKRNLYVILNGYVGLKIDKKYLIFLVRRTQASRSGGSLEDVIVTQERDPPFTLNFSASIALSNACNS